MSRGYDPTQFDLGQRTMRDSFLSQGFTSLKLVEECHDKSPMEESPSWSRSVRFDQSKRSPKLVKEVTISNPFNKISLELLIRDQFDPEEIRLLNQFKERNSLSFGETMKTRTQLPKVFLYLNTPILYPKNISRFHNSYQTLGEGLLLPIRSIGSGQGVEVTLEWSLPPDLDPL